MSRLIPKFLCPKFMRGGGIVGILLTGLVSAIAWGIGSDLYKRATKATPGPDQETGQ